MEFTPEYSIVNVEVTNYEIDFFQHAKDAVQNDYINI